MAVISQSAHARVCEAPTWCAATAKKRNVPAYVIFHDTTLREIALALPTSLAELGGIAGIGDRKLEAYGAAILARIVEVN